MQRVLELKDLKKNYYMGDYIVKALHGINLKIDRGDFVAVMGASGSGKSTLMNILGCLDKPTEGDYFFENKNINLLNDDEYAEIRNNKIGFVFQGFNLLPRTTAIENVELPLFYDRKKEKKNFKELAASALKKVGLQDRLHHHPNKLSGGQQQRVAIARALVNDPSVILADEPTGNLDTATSLDIISIFQQLNQQKITIVLVTHEPSIAVYAKRIINMRDGHIIDDKKTKQRSAKQDLKKIQE
ncbi:MAG: ABC transporter ATP-binding protein [Spirochaetes bacterium]|nr:ABC transporter ATP-binding protein [Spirochaetota bacterium]